MDTMLRLEGSTVITMRRRPALVPTAPVECGEPGGAPAATAPTSPMIEPLVLATLWLVIGAVSALDTYLTVKYRSEMHVTEQNPMGRYLIHQDGGDVSLFIGCKMGGTIACLGLLTVLAKYTRKAIVYPVFASVAMAQLTLLWYLFS